jgi:hypothetical protein
MAKVDLYPTKNAPPSQAEIQTGTVDGQKVGADTYVIGGNVTVGNAAVPPDYDEGEVQYPSATEEIYIYKKSGLTVKTVTVTYTTSAKDYISGWTIA